MTQGAASDKGRMEKELLYRFGSGNGMGGSVELLWSLSWEQGPGHRHGCRYV